MLVIKAKTLGGNIQEFRVEEILSIDGKPFKATEDDLRDAIIHLDGRVSAIESFLSRGAAEPAG